MNRDRSVNLIIAAVLVSALAHFVAMLWAKPRVMTRVAAGIVQAVRRGPMRVGEAAERPDPVRIDVVKDVESEREAPAAEESVAILPSDVTRVPEADSAISPPEFSANDIISQLRVDDSSPLVQTIDLESSARVAETPTMALEHSVPAALALPETPPEMPPAVPVAPVFEAPVFGPVAGFSEQDEPVIVETPKEDAAEVEFTPVAEVMPVVDEKVVMAEREAVKSIIDAPSGAVDLHEVIDVSLAATIADGYTYFRVRLLPHRDLRTVPKDLVVLFDASGSIGSDRLSSCRKHTREIMRTAMNSGDRFNLVAFRNDFEYCFGSWRPCDAASYATADTWLRSLAAHGRTDVFGTISSVLTLPRDPQRPLIALVITDGDANVGVRETAQILWRFTALNDGLVSVYMYGVKSEANRELIDVLTHGNRGESCIFEGWRWNSGEGLSEFAERFRDPLITDLRVEFPAACPAETYPALLRNVYRGNPVDLVGRVKGAPDEIAFSLRGIAGATAYDGFYRLPLSTALPDARLPATWAAERTIDERLHRK